MHCMGRDTQLTVNVDDDKANRFAAFMRDNDLDTKARAHRKILEEGLRSSGYPPNYTESSQRWLGLTRGIGSVLGLTALVMLGLSIFLGTVFGRYGLGLAVASIAFYAGAEVADRHGDAIYDWLRDAAKNEAEQWTASGDGGDD